MVVGSLGDIIFEVSSMRVFSPGQFTQEREFKFEDHEVVGTFPRPEFLGPGLFSLGLEIMLRRDMGCQPYEEAQELESMAMKGNVLRLIIANTNIGRCTIRKISQNWRYLDKSANGPATIGLALELKEYQ